LEVSPAFGFAVVAVGAVEAEGAGVEDGPLDTGVMDIAAAE